MIGRLRPAPSFGGQPVGSVPVGAVVAFAGQLGAPFPDTASPQDMIPTASSSPPGATAVIEAWGWMACDGRSLAAHSYPELFLVLGYLYGGSGDSFNLPDYRGYFLRGTDWGAGNDPDASARTPAKGGTAADVGSTQLSALLSHKHDYPKSIAAVVAEEGTDVGIPGVQNDLTSVPVADDGSSLSTQISQNETRPINIYVTYLIKFAGELPPLAPFLRNRGD